MQLPPGSNPVRNDSQPYQEGGTISREKFLAKVRKDLPYKCMVDNCGRDISVLPPSRGASHRVRGHKAGLTIKH